MVTPQGGGWSLRANRLGSGGYTGWGIDGVACAAFRYASLRAIPLISGTSSRIHFRENITAAGIRLPEDALHQLGGMAKAKTD